MEIRNYAGIGMGLITIAVFVYILLSMANTIPITNIEIKLETNSSPSPSIEVKDYRSDYGLPKELFSKLLPMPNDFQPTNELFSTSQLSLNNIGKEYYLQPEFYPNFKTSGIQLMKDYPQDMEAKNGYGVYPSEYILKADKDGRYEVDFMVYSSWGVVSYQGIKLIQSYQSSSTMDQNYFPDGSRSVTQNVSYVKDHIKVISITPEETILEPSYSQWNLVWNENGKMEPTLTSRHFETEWAKKITLIIDIKDLKQGKYVLGVNIGAPSDRSSQDWVFKYRTLYRVAGGYSIGKDWFNLYIVKE
jgi:hypothetical protein